MITRAHLRATFVRVLAALVLLALALFAWAQTGHFQRFLARRLVSGLARATGSRVDLEGFRFAVLTGEARLDRLTVRSREAPEMPPFFHAEGIFARVKMRSLLGRGLALEVLRLEEPRVHVATDEQGRTNIPRPPLPPDPQRSPVEPIFELGIGRLEILGGELAWNNARRPLNLTAGSVSASLDYEPGRERYRGTLASAATLRGQPSFGSDFRLRFALERNLLEIGQFFWRTPRSRIQASGVVRDFRKPAADLTYDATLDLVDIETLLRPGAFRGGQLKLAGSGHFELEPGLLRAEGRALVEGVHFLRISGISGSFHYQVGRDSAAFDPVRLSALGGTAEGRARLEQFPANPRITWSGKLRGFDLPPVASLLSTPELPVDRLRLAATISGEVELKYAFRGRALEVAGRLAMVDPGAVPAGHVPLHGRVNFQYSLPDERLTLRDALLETPSSRMALDGVLVAGGRARPESMQIDLVTTNAQEFNAVWNVPVKLLGPAEFHGAASGALRALRLDGTLRLAQFSYRDLRFDGFTGRASYSPERVEVTEGRLQRGSARVLLTAGIPLWRWQLDEDAPFTARAEVAGADLEELRAFAGLPYSVGGTISASLTAGGTWRNPALRGSVNVVRGRIYGEPFDRLRSDVRTSGRQVEWTNLELVRGQARLSGFLSHHLDQLSYRFELAGNNLPLEQFSRLQSPRLSFAGLADFRAAGSGGQVPSGRVTLRIRDLAVNGELVGMLEADAHTENDRLLFRAGSNFRQARLDALANLRLAEPYPLEGRVEFTNLDLDSFFKSYLAGRVTTHNRTDGVLTITGNLRRPEALNLAAEVRRFEIAIQNVDLRNEGPVRARYRGQTLYLEQAHLVGKETDLRISGTAGLAQADPGARPLNLQAHGGMNLALLTTMRSGLLASGQAAVSANATGTWARPALNGFVEVREALLGLQDFPNVLSRLNGTITFQNNGLQIQSLTGESGGGQVQLSGFLGFVEGLPVQLQAKANGVRVRYPPGVSTLLSGTLNFTGNTRRGVLSGEVVVTRAALSPSFDLAVALVQMKQASPPPAGEDWRQSVALDVRLLSSAGLRLESTRTRNLQAEANLRLRGTLADPALLGRLNILEGEVTFLGTTYTINRGEIAFVNPFRIEPVLNLDVGVRKQQYDISLDFVGPLDKMHIDYRSDPPLPVADIQMLLFVGRTPQTAGAGPVPQPAVSQLSGEVLAQALNNLVGSRLERFFGVSRLKIDPQVGGPENNPNARLTLEQQVARDVKLTYITNLSSAQQQIVQVEWAVNKKLSIVAVRDQNGLFGIDFQWKLRFR